MRATVRSVLRVLLLIAMLGGLGAVGVAGADAATRPGATSAVPGVPTVTIQSINDTTATVCVANFQPNSTVVLANQHNGATATIHTDAQGAGCTNIVIDRSCSATINQAIVASGVDAAGKPATAQAIAAAPPGGATCPTSSPTPTPTATEGCPPRSVAILNVYVTPQGTTVIAHACGFAPFETVNFFIFSKRHFVGSTTADATGIATDEVHIPVCIAPGQHTVELLGVNSDHIASAQFTVTPGDSCPQTRPGGGVVGPGTGHGSGPTGVHNQGGGPTGGLAFTGADILAMIIAALVLIALGVVLVTVRRRRTAPAA
jgi:hypothetical protein